MSTSKKEKSKQVYVTGENLKYHPVNRKRPERKIERILHRKRLPRFDDGFPQLPRPDRQ